jgi:serine protease Do
LKSAGVQPGFIITKIDDQKVRDAQAISEIITNKPKGEGILIEGVYPNGTRAYYGFGL